MFNSPIIFQEMSNLTIFSKTFQWNFFIRLIKHYRYMFIIITGIPFFISVNKTLIILGTSLLVSYEFSLAEIIYLKIYNLTIKVHNKNENETCKK